MMNIYKIKNNINGKCYVGQTVRSCRIRWRDHKNRALAPTGPGKSAIANAMVKYGVENFEFSVLESLSEGSSQAELDAAEIRWIKEIGSMAPSGYNLTPGGSGQGAVTDEIREKIAASKRGLKCPNHVLAAMNRNRAEMVGEKACNVKLSWEKVRAIRQDALDGVNPKASAARHGVHYSVVWRVVSNRTWKDAAWEAVKPPRRTTGCFAKK